MARKRTSMLNINNLYLREKKNEAGEIIDFGIEVPEQFNFAYDCIDKIAEHEPERRAMHWCNEAGEERSFSFGDFSRYSDQAASYLRSLGIRKGDMVMLILKRHYQFWFAILGLHKIGAVAVPGTSQLKAYDLEYRFEKAGIKAIISTMEDGVAPEIEKAAKSYGKLEHKIAVHGSRPGWLDFDLGLREAKAWAPLSSEELPKINDCMLVYFTSGTTGLAKMVAHDFSYPLAHIITAKYWQNVDPDGLHLTISETGWAKAMWGKIYGQWLMEAGIYVYDFDRFDPKKMLERISTDRVTTFCAPPTIYRFLIHEQLADYDLTALQHCTVAGEALNPEVFDRWEQATGLQIREGFGQTETTCTITTYYWMEAKSGKMGRPNPIYDVMLLNDEGEVCQTGEVGEICLRTVGGFDDTRNVGMFRGYYGDEDLTLQSWHDNIYHRHDLAVMDTDGYVSYVGRSDDMIKSSGYKISPFEVENVLMTHPAVLECAVTGEPDLIRGQLIKATIVLASGYQATAELSEEIKAYVKSKTAPYKYPRVVEFQHTLPKTISGKIRRKIIRGERD